MRPLIFILSLSIASCGSGVDEHLETVKEAVTDEAKVPQEVLSKGYRTVSLYGNKLELSIPDYFTEMSSEMKQSKYPSSNRPNVVYTDEDGTVNVAFKHTHLAVPDGNASALQSQFSQQLQAASLFDLNSRIETINGSEFAVFEFMSQAVDTRVYNLMFVTELDGRILLGTFNCTEALKVKWESRAKEILASVQKR